MKWIKLFEDFNGDQLEDAKDILRLHLGEFEEIDFIGGDLQVEMSNSLKDRIKVYKLLESPNVRDLTAFEEHFNEEEIEGVFYNVNLDWYSGQVAIIGIGESIESFLGEWLRERFSGLKKFVATGTSLKKVFYREDYNVNGGPAVFYYYENDGQDKYVYISFQSIWGFFRTVLCLEERQIRTIVHDWILEEFDLDLEPKMW
jgi:hypothetical protein